MKKYRSIVALLIIFILFITNITFAQDTENINNQAAAEDIVVIEHCNWYTSEALYNLAVKLQATYPEILELEVLDYTIDQNKLYVLRLGEGLGSPTLNTDKMHLLVESGAHAREMANQMICLNTIEEYIKDYYDDSYLEDIDVNSMLKESVFHFFINVNPDGYNLSVFGLDFIQTEAGLSAISQVEDTDYADYKANLNGVDINRNYPATYYEVESDSWIDVSQLDIADRDVTVPAGSHYCGPYPGSEIETRTVMNYFDRYDFRLVVSYHNKGEVIYWDKWFASQAMRDTAYDYATIAYNLSGYKIMPKSTGDGKGYLSDYVVSTSMKPSLTIETIPYSVDLPYVSDDYIQTAYNDTYKIPYELMIKALGDGYFDHKLYVGNRYVRDFEDISYAEAYADRLGGKIYSYEGKPKEYVVEDMSRDEFETFVISLLKYNNSSDKGYNYIYKLLESCYFAL